MSSSFTPLQVPSFHVVSRVCITAAPELPHWRGPECVEYFDTRTENPALQSHSGALTGARCHLGGPAQRRLRHSCEGAGAQDLEPRWVEEALARVLLFS